ncbi:MAG: hypothetical protein A2Z34_10445 [Planctomycetes bacterium RBG_16_59_8]|nr:MAG: hypothetical protein A2Z34_10445 [Planctomycetes bacterium RBG_16_59_8]
MTTRSPQTRAIEHSFVADDVLREVWRIKDELSASHRHDIGRLCAALQKRQRRSGHRIVDLSKERKQDGNA